MEEKRNKKKERKKRKKKERKKNFKKEKKEREKGWRNQWWLSWNNVFWLQNRKLLSSGSCPTLLRHHGLQPTRLLCPCDFPGKNPGVGCHFLLGGIFLTQGSNSSLLHWQMDSLPPSHKWSPVGKRDTHMRKAHTGCVFQTVLWITLQWAFSTCYFLNFYWIWLIYNNVCYF